MKGKNVNPKDVIKGYLEARAKDDALFAEMYKKPQKSIDTCWAYIVGVAKNRGNAVCMTDDEVYGLAVHYYCEDDLKVEPLPKNFQSRMSTSNCVKLSDEDKARLKREAEAEFKAKVMKELEAVEEQERANVGKAAEAERVKAEKERKREEAERKKREKMAAKAEAKRKETAGMGCLFDF